MIHNEFRRGSAPRAHGGKRRRSVGADQDGEGGSSSRRGHGREQERQLFVLVRVMNFAQKLGRRRSSRIRGERRARPQAARADRPPVNDRHVTAASARLLRCCAPRGHWRSPIRTRRALDSSAGATHGDRELAREAHVGGRASRWPDSENRRRSGRARASEHVRRAELRGVPVLRASARPRRELQRGALGPRATLPCSPSGTRGRRERAHHLCREAGEPNVGLATDSSLREPPGMDRRIARPGTDRSAEQRCVWTIACTSGRAADVAVEPPLARRARSPGAAGRPATKTASAGPSRSRASRRREKRTPARAR